MLSAIAALPATLDPLPPLRRDYSRGAGLRAKLRVLKLIADGSTPRHAAKMAGVPQATVLAWLGREKSR